MTLPAHRPPEPEMVQLLSPEGRWAPHPDYPLDISDDEIKSLYRDMALVRRFDGEATALQRQGELGLWAPSLGQEAAQIGAGRALRPQDMVFPSYREHGLAWCRDIDPLTLLAMFRGVNLGAWDPHEKNFHIYTIVLGAQTLHAVGYAMGITRDGAVGTGESTRDTAVLACFGDGSTSEGDVSEAFVWAGAMNLPVVFLCQNNQWAISEPVEHQSPIPLYQRSSGFGFPGVRVDGNDVLACLAVTRRALDLARAGQGPTLIEAFTYRMGAHTTSDDPTKYRNTQELEHWQARDPLERVERYLRAQGAVDDTFFADLTAEAEELALRVRSGCRALAEPDPLAVFDHVFVEPTPELLDQRAGFARFLSSFEGSGR